MTEQFYTVSLYDYSKKKHSYSKKFADNDYNKAQKYAEKIAKKIVGYQQVSILHYMKSGAKPRVVKVYYETPEGKKVINNGC